MRAARLNSFLKYFASRTQTVLAPFSSVFIFCASAISSLLLKTATVTVSPSDFAIESRPLASSRAVRFVFSTPREHGQYIRRFFSQFAVAHSEGDSAWDGVPLREGDWVGDGALLREGVSSSASELSGEGDLSGNDDL